MKLIIVVPCYNEEAVLSETTSRLTSIISRLQSEGDITEGQILYVNDGSQDATWSLIERFSQEDARVSGITVASPCSAAHSKPAHSAC